MIGRLDRVVQPALDLDPVRAEDLLRQLGQLVGGMARGEEFWVTTIALSTGSSGPSMARTSLSAQHADHADQPGEGERLGISASASASPGRVVRAVQRHGRAARGPPPAGRASPTSGEAVPDGLDVELAVGPAGAQERLDGGQRAGGVRGLVRAVQRQEDVVVDSAAGPAW